MFDDLGHYNTGQLTSQALGIIPSFDVESFQKGRNVPCGFLMPDNQVLDPSYAARVAPESSSLWNDPPTQNEQGSGLKGVLVKKATIAVETRTRKRKHDDSSSSPKIEKSAKSSRRGEGKDPAKKGPGRKGPLGTESRLAANGMRKTRACFLCHQLGQKVSPIPHIIGALPCQPS